MSSEQKATTYHVAYKHMYDDCKEITSCGQGLTLKGAIEYFNEEVSLSAKWLGDMKVNPDGTIVCVERDEDAGKCELVPVFLGEAAQPATTITAAEFIEDDYASKIHNHECVVILGGYGYILYVKPSQNATDTYNLFDICGTDGSDYGRFTDATRMSVYWNAAQPATTADGAGEAELSDSAALDHVSTQWVQLHMALSEALGLDFEPAEDIERYTEAIASLQVELAAAKAENARLKARLEPFARVYDAYTDFDTSEDFTEWFAKYIEGQGMLYTGIPISWFREAKLAHRAALADGESEGGT